MTVVRECDIIKFNAELERERGIRRGKKRDLSTQNIVPYAVRHHVQMLRASKAGYFNVLYFIGGDLQRLTINAINIK